MEGVVGTIDYWRRHMLYAEMRLVISQDAATLTLTSGDREIDADVWKIKPSISRAVAINAARCIFDDAYDFLNHTLHAE